MARQHALFAIITIDASPDVTELHNRMPAPELDQHFGQAAAGEVVIGGHEAERNAG